MPKSDYFQQLLVTCCVGFLWSLFRERPLDARCDVLCRDNLYPGRKVTISRLQQAPLFRVLNHDIVKPVVQHVSHILDLVFPALHPAPARRFLLVQDET